MADLASFRFDITGATGSQGALGPKSSWRAYILPRGAHASQASTGTLITVDSAATASRFAANDWIQVALSTSNIRQVSAVGGNSFSINTAVTVSENDRIYLIGTTQPTVSGGSATYNTPNTTIRKRDDSVGDTYSNSMLTSDSNGMIQGFCQPNYYDVLIQDGDQSNQGSIIDLPVGSVGGVSTSTASVFGATVTINAALGVTGTVVFGQTVTANAAFGVTGHATMGDTLTVNGNVGVTGHAIFANTVTIDGALGITGSATLASTLLVGATGTINGAFGVTGAGLFGTSLTVDGQFGVTGHAQFGTSLTVDGQLGVTGHAIFANTVTVNGALGVTGSFTITGDLAATGGFRQQVDGWWYSNPADSVAGITLSRGPSASYPFWWVPCRAGSIVGIWVSTDPLKPMSGATMSFYPAINGVSLSGLEATLDNSVNTYIGTSTQAKDTAGATFVAGDSISIQFSSLGNIAPNNGEFMAGLEIED